MEIWQTQRWHLGLLVDYCKGIVLNLDTCVITKFLIDFSDYLKGKVISRSFKIRTANIISPSGYFQPQFWTCSDIFIFIQMAFNLETFTRNLKKFNDIF